MADEKKYTAQEAAFAVLAKAGELLAKSDLIKAEDSRKENEIGTKFVKAENQEKPSNPMKPKIEEKPIERDNQDFETKPGHAPENDHRQAPQQAPSANPKEQAEGNNPPAGTVPGRNGVDKLRWFHGHKEGKRSAVKKGM